LELITLRTLALFPREEREERINRKATSLDLRKQIEDIKNEMDEILADQNDINENTRFPDFATVFTV